MSDGCEQRERFPAALREGYFRPDETRFDTLVAMSAGLASHLRFFDVSMREMGTWGELFDGDEALVLARIAATELQVPQQHFLRDADAAPLPELAVRVMALASLIDGWLKCLRSSRHAAGRSVLARIELLLEQPLGDDLQWVLERFGSHHFGSQPMQFARRRFDPAWFGRAEMRDPWAQRSDREMLRRRFFSFVSAIERIQDLAREKLPESLSSQTHAPAAGLLLAFLQLYQQRIQPHLNRFTERHTDFYYDDCLRMQPLPAIADAVHLVCQRSPQAAGEVLVPKGTRFGAGKDAQGLPIEFQADDDLRVTDCRVAALLTLRLDRDPLISPEREFGYVTRIDAARLPWPAAPEAASPETPHPYWPLFGGTPQGPAGGQAETRVGLAIASPIFLLAGGQREIDLGFQLAQAVDVDHRLQHLAAQTLAEPRAMRRRLPPLFKRYLLLAPELLSSLDRADLNGLATRLARQAQERQADEAHETQGAADASIAPLGLYERFLLELTVRAPTRELYFRRLGKVFSRWLLAREDWLTEPRLKALRDTAARLIGETDRPAPAAGDPRCLLQGPHRPERALIFGQLFSSIFRFHLSTPNGWLPISDFFVDRGESHGNGACGALRIVLHLRPQDPAVVGCSTGVHGAEWPTEQPVLRIQLCDEGRLHPYSLMEDVVLTEVSLAVRVQGVRDVVMHNNLGRLDPSKPFMPFGPLPTLASYCVFGSEELARKNVTRLDVQVEWSGLPIERGGFASYYAGYDSALRNSSYTATASILRDGQWHTAGAPGSLSLFSTADAAGRLSALACWRIDDAALRTHGRATQEPLDFQLGARNGYYRVQLHAPAIAFGHAAYPLLLTEAVSANTLRRRGRRPLVLPNPPYTPTIERITLDYEAQSHIVLSHERSAGGQADLERVLHLHPYGISQVYPGATGAGPGLWPRFAHNGSLYIGLSVGSGEDLSGTLTLHFHLRDESAVESLNGETREPPGWSYLASNQWRPLSPSQVVADTTCGFLTSGIVTLNLPAQADRLSTILPNAYYWLRLSVDHGFDHYAGLYGVRTQALRASRVPPGSAAAAAAPLPAGSVTEPLVTVPGLASVQQIGPSFGMRAAEDRRQMLTRTGERLQHRQRASTPWDYERLVLERFPSVLKVKCFSHQLASVDGVSPGEVLVVVVPAPPVAQAGGDTAAPLLSATAEPHLNAVELARIRDTLRGLASPFAQIQVRNPIYERIQVRCTVKLARGVQQGQALRRINQAITDYLSPWREGGLRPCFDWTVRCEDVEAHLRALDCVAFVTQLSLLHVARSDAQVYTLGDTARSQGLLATQVRPRSAWSIVLPMREHMVDAVEVPTDERPEATGIARLGLGHTFILGAPVGEAAS